MRVRVFRNLTAGPKGKPPVYSIQARAAGGWRTVAHAAHVMLDDVRFRVSTAGVARIRATGRKTVCATLEGQLVDWSGVIRPAGEGLEPLARWQGAPVAKPTAAVDWVPVAFNPHRDAAFRDWAGPVDVARLAHIGAAGVAAVDPVSL